MDGLLTGLVHFGGENVVVADCKGGGGYIQEKEGRDEISIYLAYNKTKLDNYTV